MSDRTWMTVPSHSSSFMGIIETSLKSVDDRVLQYIIWKVVPGSTTRWVKVGFRNTGINFLFTAKSDHLYKRDDPDWVPSLNMQVPTSCKKRKYVGHGTYDIEYTSPEAVRYSRRQRRTKNLSTQLLILCFF